MLYTIDKEEILDYMLNVQAPEIINILELLKNYCKENNIPLLNNTRSSSSHDFVELILDCLDINLIFSEKNKLN